MLRPAARTRGADRPDLRRPALQLQVVPIPCASGRGEDFAPAGHVEAGPGLRGSVGSSGAYLAMLAPRLELMHRLLGADRDAVSCTWTGRPPRTRACCWTRSSAPIACSTRSSGSTTAHRPSARPSIASTTPSWSTRNRAQYTFNADAVRMPYDAVHGQGLCRLRQRRFRQGAGSGARQGAGGLVVLPRRRAAALRANRLPDPEAGGAAGADRPRLQPPRRPRGGLLLRFRHDGRGRGEDRPALVGVRRVTGRYRDHVPPPSPRSSRAQASAVDHRASQSPRRSRPAAAMESAGTQSGDCSRPQLPSEVERPPARRRSISGKWTGTPAGSSTVTDVPRVRGAQESCPCA